MALEIHKILVPIDGSEGAEKAAEFAGHLARHTNAAVTLLRVHSPEIYQLSVLSEIPPLTDFEYMDVMQKHLSDPEKDPAFAEAKQAIGALSAPIEVRVAWGQPAQAICDYAKENAIDHIVIGSRGRSAFSALVLGSVSLQVLHHAPCPVTVVR